MLSPLYLFLVPGTILAAFGLLCLLLPAGGGVRIADLHFDIHWMALGVLLFVVGVQIVQFGFLARLYTTTYRFRERNLALEWLRRHFKVEHGLLLGAVLFGIGLAIDGYVLTDWIAARFGTLERTRPALVATGLMAVGLQFVFFAFLAAILTPGKRPAGSERGDWVACRHAVQRQVGMLARTRKCLPSASPSDGEPHNCENCDSPPEQLRSPR